MICDRCGRLLNRATGQCVVCAESGGVAPPPVATREAAAGTEAPDVPAVRGPSRDPGESPAAGPGPSAEPSEAPSIAATVRPASPYTLAPLATPPAPAAPAASPPAPPAAPPVPTPSVPAPPPEPEPEQPISMSAAVAILDLSDRPEKTVRAPSRPSPGTPTRAAEPPPLPRPPGAPVGVVRSARVGRRKVDLVAYDGNLVMAPRGAPDNLTSGQLAAQDPSSRILTAEAVEDVVVREDPVSGQARIKVRVGDDLVVRWPGWKNRGFSAENLLAHSFPGKVDQGSSEIAQRTVRVMVGVGVTILVAVAAYLGLSTLLKSDPPPPPPPAPPTTLAPAEQAARTALQQSCPAWQQFAGTVPAGERPSPTAMRPVVEGMGQSFVAAADAGADPLYATARDEVGYLQEYARRPVDDVARESVSRVSFAMRTVSAACNRATAGS